MEKGEKIISGIYDKNEITQADIYNYLKKIPAVKDIGSILSFSGIVRGTDKHGKLVKGMKIDAYKEMANKSIVKICNEIKSRPGIIEIILVHFQGDFDLSEDLVHVFIASSHRAEGFKSLRDAVEMYKKEIAVWKREDFQNGTSEWVH